MHDPKAMDNARGLSDADVYGLAIAACRDADVVLHLTEWPEFREIDPKLLGTVVASKNVVDGRNLLDRTVACCRLDLPGARSALAGRFDHVAGDLRPGLQGSPQLTRQLLVPVDRVSYPAERDRQGVAGPGRDLSHAQGEPGKVDRTGLFVDCQRVAAGQGRAGESQRVEQGAGR